MLEMAVAMTITSIAALTAFPAIRATQRAAQLRAGAQYVANDMAQAISLSRRVRQPLTLTCDNTAGSYVLTLRNGNRTAIGATIRSAEFGMESFSCSPTAVMILPSGVLSTALTATLSAGTQQRIVRTTIAGITRVTTQ